jgi:hypothetical protein
MRPRSDLLNGRGNRNMARRNTCIEAGMHKLRPNVEGCEYAVKAPRSRREKDRRLDAGASSLRVLVSPFVVDQRRRRPARPISGASAA